MENRQRLVVCLDGTWNNRDDSTNVLHHFSLAYEGDVTQADGRIVSQKKYYHEGVGTGVLDRVSGGAFGFGLEDNVRAAYNWLIQHFNDGTDTHPADEIYIFGFSRGAYTARSLVGLISRCGLLHRAAPLTVNQLWENYCLLGREHEERRESPLFRDIPRFRQITDLIYDPWQIARGSGASRSSDPDRVPGQKEVRNLNDTERLLVRWSRRVRITFLGIYDTVGALGYDALAIPGLKSKLALHHNMRPTTLIQKCRHALAIDENRSSFSHTPFRAYMGHEGEEAEQDRAQEPRPQEDPALAHETTAISRDHGRMKDAKLHWLRSQAMWSRKIEQHWFVGAHSNIGGGYPDNRLAEAPFRWVLEGAIEAGLQCEPLRAPPLVSTRLPSARDSFAEFAKPFWTMIFRGKRHYRPIDPERESQARSKQPKKSSHLAPGFSLQSIGEKVDGSVFRYWRGSNPPPNLIEYARRTLGKTPSLERRPELMEMAALHPLHTWLENAWSYLVLVLWATFASIGLAAANQLICGKGSPEVPLWLTCAAAFLFPLIDWAESRVNFSQAVGRTGPGRRAFLDSIYWLRALGLVLFVIGSFAAAGYLWGLGWKDGFWSSLWNDIGQLLKAWWFVPLLATVGTATAAVLARVFHRGSSCDPALLTGFEDGLRQNPETVQPSALSHASSNQAAPDKVKTTPIWKNMIALAGGTIVAVAAVPMTVLLGSLAAHILTPAFGLSPSLEEPSPADARFAGLLLLLQLSVAYFLRAFAWVGEPMARANLGWIVPLQFRVTPEGVENKLEQWRSMLACRWWDEDPANGPAASRMRELVREELYRDIFGFIPVYLAVLVFGLWFAGSQLHWDWLMKEFGGIPLWLLLPLIAAGADYIEDACHLHYLRRHQKLQPPKASWTMVGFIMALVKFGAYGTAALTVSCAAAWASWEVALRGESTGWRGTIVLIISTFVILSVAGLLFGVLCYRLFAGKNRRIVEPSKGRAP